MSATVGKPLLVVTGVAAEMSATVGKPLLVVTGVAAEMSATVGPSSSVADISATTDVVLTAGVSAVRGFICSVASGVSVAIAEWGAKLHMKVPKVINIAPIKSFKNFFNKW